MILTISGYPGSGKNTIADILAKKLNLKRYSAGGGRRNMAKQQGLNLKEFNKLGEKQSWTDIDIDEWQKKIGKTEDNFIIDGRLSYYFIPNSQKIFLDVSPEIGAKRIMLAQRPEERFSNIEQAVMEWHERIASDKKRYKKYYRITDCYEHKNFDLVIDTSEFTSPKPTIKIILSKI